MKKILLFLFLGFLLMPSLHASYLIRTVEEEDGTPSLTNPDGIKFTNGTLTNNGDGTVSVSISGGSTLDAAYEAGRTINVDSSLPIIINNSGTTANFQFTGYGISPTLHVTSFDPESSLTAELGSLVIDGFNGALYVKTSQAGLSATDEGWTELGAGGGGSSEWVDGTGTGSIKTDRNLTLAAGDNSLSVGPDASAAGNSSVALGVNSSASQTDTVAIAGGVASAQNATAIGESSVSSGRGSFTFGYGVQAPSYQESALGIYNTTYTPDSTTAFDADDRLFGIGNGISTARSDALVILKNGNTGIGNASPERTLHVTDTLRIEPRSAAPSSPSEGDLYVDSDSNELCFYDGSVWTGLKAGGTCA